MGIDLTIERLDEAVPGFEYNSRGAARAFDQHLTWGDDDPTGCSGNGVHIDCWRPLDFALARQWVDKHLPEPSTTRTWYLDALALMEADDAVCVRISR